MKEIKIKKNNITKCCTNFNSAS